MPSKIKLHSYWRSSCSYRVRIALALKKIPYDYVPVNILPNVADHKKEGYLKMNPFGFVPTLEIIDDNNQQLTLIESMAIIDYLENAFPEPALFPKNQQDRANAIAIAEAINSGIQPLQNISILVEIAKLGGNKDEWTVKLFTQKFESLELLLASTAGKYCVKDTISIADVFLVPQIYNANRFGLQMSQFPTIDRIHKLLQEHEAIKTAHPSVQPDGNK